MEFLFFDEVILWKKKNINKIISNHLQRLNEKGSM